MNRIWFILVIVCIIYGIVAGNGEDMTVAVLSSGSGALNLSLSLAGAYMLWCGMLNIMEKSGVIDILSRIMLPVFKLFPNVTPKSPAGRSISVNLSANLLGLGNAATPAGIAAMREMKKTSLDGDAPSDAMRMFLVINSSSIQLIPTTVISMRAAAGSASASDIILPTLLSTACSTAVAIIAMLLWIAAEKRRRDSADQHRNGRRAAFIGGGRRLWGVPQGRRL